MSADLDDMFAALGHHADALPLAPATQLRRRGERRRRNRVVAAAAAVLLIAAGSGVVAWHREHRPVLPAAPNAPVRGLKAVPDPVPAGEGREWVYPTVADHRVFAVSRSSATSYRLVAVDERTGRVLWSTPDRTGDATHPFTVPGAVLLHTEKGLEIRDAATGADRWQLRFDRQDQIVLSADVVVRTTATNGTTEAFDMRTGALRWSVPGGADRPAYTFGNRGEDGVFRAQLLFQGTFSTGTLGQRLRSGRTLVRDLHTGRTLHSLDPEPPAEQIRVQDGTLFWLAGAQVRTAAMDGRDGGSRVLRTLPRGWRLESYFACGTGRICLIESASKDYREGRVVVVDVASARVLWQQAVPYAVAGPRRTAGCWWPTATGPPSSTGTGARSSPRRTTPGGSMPGTCSRSGRPGR